MISSLDDLLHFIDHIANILRVSLLPILFGNVNYPLSNVKGQISVAGHELEARHSFLFLGGGSGSFLVIFITVDALDNGRHRFKRFTHCTLKQILSISKDCQLAIMVEVVTIIGIQHANRKTVVIAIAGWWQ
jgi:hypothetical protein